MDLLFTMLGVLIVIISYWQKTFAKEVAGFLFIVVGLSMHGISVYTSFEIEDHYIANAVGGTVFSEPTEVIETTTRYPLSFMPDKTVVYTVRGATINK